MPVKKDKYPANWPDLRKQVQFRAGDKCEKCAVSNHEYGARDRRGKWHSQEDIDGMNSDYGYSLFGDYPKIIRIVCTTAHLDHDTDNNNLDNLQFLCQRCHLAHDAVKHQEAAAITRRRKKDEMYRSERRRKEKIQPPLF